MKCKKCEKEIGTNCTLASHMRWCGVVKPSSYSLTCGCGSQFTAKSKQARYCEKCKIVASESHRKKMSELKKKWLAENPERHPWKNKEKSNSVPCEVFKRELTKAGLLFVQEFSPVPGRHFSLDVAFPTKRIGVEINGNQHYNSDKTLKKYYQDRHDLIVAEGWQVLELHYSIAFQKEKLAAAVKALKGCIDKVEFEYEFYLPEKKIKEKKEKNVSKRVTKEKCLQARRLSEERLTFYKTKILEALPTERGFAERAAKTIGVSSKQVRKTIKNHLPEFVEYLNTPSKFLPEEKRKPIRIIQTKKERLDEYKTKIAEAQPGTPGFANRLAISLGVRRKQIWRMIRRHFPELRNTRKTQ